MVDWSEDIQKTDQRIIDLKRELTPQAHRNPVNEEECKQRFLKDQIKNPSFEYDIPKEKIEGVRNELNSIKVPDTPFKPLYNRVLRHIEQQIEFLVAIGTEDSLAKSEALYGKPSQELEQKAREILEKNAITPYREEKTFVHGSQQLRERLEEELQKYGLVDWTVELSDKRQTTVYPSLKKITICGRRNYSTKMMKRLEVHEIGVHVLRTHNGYKQPTKLFGLGLPNYVKTEEGIAIMAERTANLPNTNRLVTYAARVVSVQNRRDEQSFRDCFEDLVSYGFDRETAWDHTLRAYRSGGLCKDHIYLQGYYEMRDVLDEGSPSFYYLGKFGVEHKSIVKKLQGKGLLNEPDIVPSFWQK